MSVSADVFVDTTGDACLSILAGAKYEKGRKEDGLCQPMTTNMRLFNVNVAAIKEQILAYPNNFNVKDKNVLARSPRLSVAGFYKEFSKAKEEGRISTSREDVLMFETIHPGEVIVNTTRVIKCDPVDPWQLSYAEMQGRKQAMELYHFFKESCRGFENATYISTGVRIGVRESNRVLGDYVLCAEDLLLSKRFEDTIALGGYPIDIHNPTGESTKTTRLKKGQYYSIPMRSLIASGLDNLVVAGRCISCTHEAQAAIRVTPIAMAIGQAAGVLAAAAATTHKSIRLVEYKTVKERLLEQKAILS